VVRQVRLRPEVDLVGEGAACFPRGVYFADEGQWFDMQPYIRHIAPRATSDVLFKGALQGKSRTIFRGNVWVGADAVGTDTNETNRSLILTDGARADSTPFLEIFCADITAGHGSATGQIDARHLFYLESRGIPRQQALRLIVFGFFREVLDELDLPGVQDRALAHIEREISTADLSRIGVGRLTDEVA
jgi:Fe-S cluster assembly protein SufD